MNQIKEIQNSIEPQIKEVQNEFKILTKQIFEQFSDEFNYESQIKTHYEAYSQIYTEFHMEFQKGDYDKIFQNLEILYNHVRKEELKISYEFDLTDIWARISMSGRRSHSHSFSSDTNQTISSFKKDYWQEIQSLEGIKKRRKTDFDLSISSNQNQTRSITIWISDINS